MISHADIVRVPESVMSKALEWGMRNPEPGHANKLTGELRSAGAYIVKEMYGLEKNVQALILRLKTTQVVGKMLYVPIGFVRKPGMKIVAVYVHMPASRLATADSVTGMTVAGWARAEDLQTLHTPGYSMICVRNTGVLEPMKDIGGKDA